MSDAKSPTQFWIGSVVVPVVVAIITGAIVWSTGIFDAQSKLIEAEKIQFQIDTGKYAGEKAIILSRLAKLSLDSAELSSKIKEKESKSKIADSIYKIKDKSLSAQQKIVVNLSYENQALKSASMNNLQNTDALKREIARLKDNNTTLSGNISKFFQSWDPWVTRLNKGDTTALIELSYINSEANDMRNAVKYFGH